MTVHELKMLLENRQKIFLLDVREPDEWNFARIGGTNIPLGELSQRYEEIPHNSPIVCICHHGIRSAQAVQFLRSTGFEEIHNLSGGIDRWSKEIDPKIPTY
jgi:rhodanese-related sulfurtransferase